MCITCISYYASKYILLVEFHLYRGIIEQSVNVYMAPGEHRSAFDENSEELRKERNQIDYVRLQRRLVLQHGSSTAQFQEMRSL